MRERYGRCWVHGSALAGVSAWVALAGICASTSLVAQVTTFSRAQSVYSIPDVIAGRVVNARGGGPVARALVQVGDRAVLTDSEGRFRFEQPGQSTLSLRVTKPGFSTNPEQADTAASASAVGADPAALSSGRRAC